MSTVLVFVSLCLLAGRSPGQSFAFGGDSTGKQVQSDPFLGDWQGQWIAPRGKAAENPSLVAQIIPRGEGRYRINILSEFDHRCVPYAILDAEARDDEIRFEEGRWSGVITQSTFTGNGIVKNTVGRFELKKVVRLSPTLGARPPSNAIVLFDGSGFDEWNASGRSSKNRIGWELEDDFMRTVVPSDGPRHGIRTKRLFRDCRLHIEFRLPLEPKNTGQGRANSGVHLARFEIQVLDSYGLPGYYNECGALYKMAAPMVNMCAPPLQWQTYDITYHTVRLDENGHMLEYPRMTVYHNGKLIHKDREIVHQTSNSQIGRAKPFSDAPAPISISNHGHPIEYRNIWLVDLSVSEDDQESIEEVLP